MKKNENIFDTHQYKIDQVDMKFPGESLRFINVSNSDNIKFRQYQMVFPLTNKNSFQSGDYSI